MTGELTNEQIAAKYMERIERTTAKEGKAAGIQRGTAMLMSWTIGREFGETVDSYFARNPEKKKFAEMFNAWRTR
jgi:hypothetical protein